MNGDPFDQAATLALGEYLLRVRTMPFACLLSPGSSDHPIWQMRAVWLRPEGGTWQRALWVELETVEVDRLALRFTTEDGSFLKADITKTEDQLRLELRSEMENTAWLGVDLHARPDEHYLGFGERFDSLGQLANALLAALDIGR